MESQKLTYELKRLQNIRRNDEIMAALKLRSKATQLSNFKRQRVEAKSTRVKSEKKPKTETPVLIRVRRSLRTRGDFEINTSCYDGVLGLMDAEKEIFDLELLVPLMQLSAPGIWRYTNRNDLTASRTFTHKRSVQSAYFSPSGGSLATTSLDNTIGIYSGVNLEDTAVISHFNQTGRWLSTFRAKWGWDDKYLFIGNMNKGMDVVSAVQRQIVMTLESPHRELETPSLSVRSGKSLWRFMESKFNYPQATTLKLTARPRSLHPIPVE
ncbi:hypothetical protein V8G54_015579 [Vigna mungo]|uniref:Uncharacterized protein n=1 Tax=Vigna mungo TaxID=3915 RepID=A0AAQ3RWZ0_VIGMU